MALRLVTSCKSLDLEVRLKVIKPTSQNHLNAVPEKTIKYFQTKYAEQNP